MPEMSAFVAGEQYLATGHRRRRAAREVGEPTTNFLTMREDAMEAAWRWNREVPDMQAVHGKSGL